MKTYEFNYWGLGGVDFEGYVSYEFNKKELDLIRAAIDDGWDAFGDTDDLEKIYDNMLRQIAEFAVENWWYASEIYDKYCKRGVTHKTAMYRYLKDSGVEIPFSFDLRDDLESEDEEE